MRRQSETSVKQKQFSFQLAKPQFHMDADASATFMRVGLPDHHERRREHIK
jgi:hypothetical protein